MVLHLATVGNIGSASIWVMLDAFLKSGSAESGREDSLRRARKRPRHGRLHAAGGGGMSFRPWRRAVAKRRQDPP